MFKMYTFIEYLVTIYIILYVQVIHTRMFLIRKTERVTSVRDVHTRDTVYRGETKIYHVLPTDSKLHTYTQRFRVSGVVQNIIINIFQNIFSERTIIIPF